MSATRTDLISDHLRTMRLFWIGALVAAGVVAVANFMLPRLRADAASPAAVTVIAIAGSAWVGLTADRDARLRLERAKRAFAVNGDIQRLLRDHRTVFAIVLLRLEIVVVCSVVVAVWGLGPFIALWFALLAAAMVGLARPSERKTLLLVERAEELRGED